MVLRDSNIVQCKSLEPPLISLYFPFKQPDFLVTFKAVLNKRSPGFMKVFQSFSLYGHWLLFSLIFSPVLVPEHFQRNEFLFVKPPNTGLFKSLKHKKRPLTQGMNGCWVYI